MKRDDCELDGCNRPALAGAGAGVKENGCVVGRPFYFSAACGGFSSQHIPWRKGPRTTIKFPTQTSESLTFPAVLMKLIVCPVAQNGDSGLAT